MYPPQVDPERRALLQMPCDGVERHDWESMNDTLREAAKDMGAETPVVEWEEKVRISRPRRKHDGSGQERNVKAE